MRDYSSISNAFKEALSPDDLPDEAYGSTSDFLIEELREENRVEFGADYLEGGWLNQWRRLNPEKAAFMDKLEEEHTQRVQREEPELIPPWENKSFDEYEEEENLFVAQRMVDYLLSVGKTPPEEIIEYIEERQGPTFPGKEK